jgi:hypothetical protein
MTPIPFKKKPIDQKNLNRNPSGLGERIIENKKLVMKGPRARWVGEKNLGWVRLCSGGSGPHEEPGQRPSISINCKRRASQVQLVYLLLEVSSLTGASLLLDVPWWWTLDVPREAVDVSCEGWCISVCMQSCPTHFGSGPMWDLHLWELLGTPCRI